MDEEVRRYELDLLAMAVELIEALAERGYHTLEHTPEQVWRFETRWSRGAAYGEIGSMLYTLVDVHLRQLEP
ncbi:MAG: hypothetical protein M3Z66_13510 [Chloroflexota bacterium]|nr:hypothetical protein [Chloroflexota bacterium]